MAATILRGAPCNTAMVCSKTLATSATQGRAPATENHAKQVGEFSAAISMKSSGAAAPMTDKMIGQVPCLRDMPVVIAQAQLRLSRPPVWTRKDGVSLSTSMRGLLLKVIVERACANAGACAAKTPLHCRHSASCQAPWLLAPRSEPQKRDHAPPLTLHIEHAAEDCLHLRVVLWGHRAGAAQLAVWTALADAGHRGLIDDRGTVKWQVQTGALTSRNVGALCQAPPADRLWLGIDGLQDKQAFDLAKQFGNLAHDLTQFSLADSGHDANLTKSGCDALADASREAVKDAFAHIEWQWQQAELSAQGKRNSCRNAGWLHLGGISGLVSLQGDLQPLLPWLVLASHWGLAGRKSFGQGRIHLWAEDGSVWPRPCIV